MALGGAGRPGCEWDARRTTSGRASASTLVLLDSLGVTLVGSRLTGAAAAGGGVAAGAGSGAAAGVGPHDRASRRRLAQRDRDGPARAGRGQQVRRRATPRPTGCPGRAGAGRRPRAAGRRHDGRAPRRPTRWRARFGRATRLRPGAHPHGSWGVAGAAAGCARLLGLDAAARSRRPSTPGPGMPVAAHFSSALDGNEVRNAWMGAANLSGLAAARMAAAGVARDTGTAALSLGERARRVRPGRAGRRARASAGTSRAGYFKRHAACSFTHPAADVVLGAAGPAPARRGARSRGRDPRAGRRPRPHDVDRRLGALFSTRSSSRPRSSTERCGRPCRARTPCTTPASKSWPPGWSSGRRPTSPPGCPPSAPLRVTVRGPSGDAVVEVPEPGRRRRPPPHGRRRTAGPALGAARLRAWPARSPGSATRSPRLTTSRPRSGGSPTCDRPPASDPRGDRVRIHAVTPIHVDADELARRQTRYDALCPAGLHLELHDIGPDAPRALDTAASAGAGADPRGVPVRRDDHRRPVPRADPARRRALSFLLAIPAVVGVRAVRAARRLRRRRPERAADGGGHGDRVRRRLRVDRLAAALRRAPQRLRVRLVPDRARARCCSPRWAPAGCPRPDRGRAT